MGEACRPVPWDMLFYDTDKGGYLMETRRKPLLEVSSHARGDEPFRDRDYGRAVCTCYTVGH